MDNKQLKAQLAVVKAAKPNAPVTKLLQGLVDRVTAPAAKQAPKRSPAKSTAKKASK